VIRIRGGVEVLLVTTDAVGRRALKLPAHMTGRAVQSCVRTCERESGQAVIEFRALPGVHRGMALLASRRKSERPMIGGLGIHVTADVAPNTIGRQAFKTSHGGVLVTRIAFDERVGAQQRESILVVTNRLNRRGPALHVMALLTLRTHLAAMDISMAISALVPHVGENRAGVALGARHALMHAP